MFNAMLLSILGVLFPRIPKWLLTSISELFSAITGMVEAAQKSPLAFEQWVEQLDVLLDRALDAVPGWRDLPEVDRDAVLKGLSTLTIWLYQLHAKGETSNKELRQSFRDAGDQMRRDMARIEDGVTLRALTLTGRPRSVAILRKE